MGAGLLGLRKEASMGRVGRQAACPGAHSHSHRVALRAAATASGTHNREALSATARISETYHRGDQGEDSRAGERLVHGDHHLHAW